MANKKEGFLLIGDPHLDSKTPLARIDNYRETTINKLRSLLQLAIDKKVRAVITTGDVFNRYDVPISYLNEVVHILREYRFNGIEVYSIIGNHDIPRNNMDYFKNTPLSLLFKSGLVKKIGSGKDDRLVIGETVVYGLNYKEKLSEIETPRDGYLNKILVMHYATENTVPADNVPLVDLESFDIVFAGHDHMYYEPIITEDLEVYRPGSFTRRTKDEYNLERDIIVCHSKGDYEVEELILPGVEPAVSVFKDKVFNQDIEDLYNNNYSSLFSDLSEDKEYASIFDILEDLPPDVKEESLQSILKFLESEGIRAEVKKKKPETIDYESAFSE
jgi:DNA repair exonuclease SbcCD nuclease subunit